MTIKTDDVDELFGIQKAVKHIVRQSKQKAEETSPQAETAAETQPDAQRCDIHNVDMPRRWSKRTGGHYFAHKLADGSFCY